MKKVPNQKAKKLILRLGFFTLALALLTYVGIELFERGVLLGDSYVPILLAIPTYLFGVIWLFFATWNERSQ